MARKPVFEFELDDSIEEDDQVEDAYDKCMEEVSEILARAYDEIGDKVRALVDELEADR